MSFFQKLFDKTDSNIISGLTDELKCLYILNKFISEKNSVILVCNSLFEANKMYNFLRTYSNDVLFFPMDDFIASEILAISPELLSTRLETLNILQKTKKIIVTNLMGYLRYLPLPSLFYSKYIELKNNCSYNTNELVAKLYDLGYKKETLVNKPGEMSVRGYILDIFPINYDNPIRIEFWGDMIESIRIFDVNNQLTIENVDKIQIIPNTEFVTTEENIENKTQQASLKKYGLVCNIKEYLNNGILFYNDYRDLKISYKILENQIKEFCIGQNKDMSSQFMYSLDELSNSFIDLCKFDNGDGKNYVSYVISDKFNDINETSQKLTKYLNNYQAVIICVSNMKQGNKLTDIIKNNIILTNENNIIDNKINIIVKNINEGFIFKNNIVISEKELFNARERPSPYKSNFKYGTKIKDMSSLSLGDYVVHHVHGIGRYCGLKTISKNGLMKDYLKIEYKDNDSLYIPVEKIEFISKYSGNGGLTPKLNKLGSLEWQKVKLNARKKASDIAKDLINLYASREMVKGYPFEKDDENQNEFEREFIYTPTDSQIKTMEDIKSDMESSFPMDRLICGDVGYGKTELAFRAAFKAIISKKQVALLCPTTILSNQHFQNALERFKSFPINIKLLNRFTTTKETSKIIEGLKKGTVDFVIGTHKLLNDKITYLDLGLLIIDEEQRFGVKHKEKIKKYRNNIDILTLSATPIPRTLQMSLSGVRSLSLLETPPKDRYPIQTYVLSYNDAIIKDAIYKELSRFGQVFILYNKISNIEDKCRQIQELVKEAKVIYAHGQLPKTELENRMMDFINKKYDVLICTTIIETGIDIPNVNTLVIIDADHFGLSQLYQLRGRVGRTNKIAYCYLMYDNRKILSELALKRLNSIKEFTELGSGFAIAMRDLTLRGAGDILGSEQAGFIDSVGIELFTKILKEEIEKLKGTYLEEEIDDNQALIDVETYVESEYVEEDELKIEIHRMINDIHNLDTFNQVKSNLEDRFGTVSEKLIIYMYEQWFETLASKLKVKKVIQNKNIIEIIFDKEITAKIDGKKLFMESYKINSNFKVSLILGCITVRLNLNGLEKHFIYYLVSLLELVEKAI